MPRVRFFGHLAQVLGTRSLEVEAATLGGLLTKLEERFGDDLRSRLGHCQILLGEAPLDAEADAARALDPDDEVGVLPPAAGG